MSESSAYLLKVFSGPHVGAEILLADGDYLIGSDDACDVIFSDRFVAPHHAKITLAGDAIHLLPLDSAGVFVDGQRIEETGRRLQAFQYFTLGNTHLALGPADATWPHIEFPEFQLNAPPPPEPAEPDTEAPPETPVIAPPATEVRPEPARRRWLVPMALLVLLIPLLWGASVLWGRSGTEGPVGPTTEERLNELAKTLNASGSVVLVKHKDGRLHLDGYVKTREERNKVTSQVHAISPAVRCRVYDTDSLTVAVREVLAGTEMPFQAAPGKPGEVIVSGQGTDKARWKVVQQRIQEDVRMLRKLEDQVRFPSHVKPVETVKVAVPPPALPKPEPLIPPELPPLTEKTAVAIRTDDAAPAVAPMAPPEAPEKPGEETPILSLEYVSVSVGANACLNLPGGQRLFEGAIVNDGFRIKSITPQALVLVRGDEERVLPLGGARGDSE